MFKESYRKKIDGIHVREDLLDEIKAAEGVQEKSNARKNDRRRQWIIAIPAAAVAVAACLAVGFGIGRTAGKKAQDRTAVSGTAFVAAEAQPNEEKNASVVPNDSFALHAESGETEGTANVPEAEPAQEQTNVPESVTPTAVQPVGSYEELGNIMQSRMNAGGRGYVYGGDFAVNDAMPVAEAEPMPEPAVEAPLTMGDSVKSYETNSETGRAYSGTNNQVEGIDEADIVKTDGQWIYALNQNQNKIYILSAEGKNSEIVGTIIMKMPPEDAYYWRYYSEMMLYGDRLYLLGNYNDWSENVDDMDRQYTIAEVYDISDRTAPKLIATHKQQGNYQTARLVDGMLLIVSDYRFYYWNYPVIDGPMPFVDYCPRVISNDEKVTLLPDEIYVNPDSKQNAFTVITVINAADGSEFDSHKAVLGGCDQVYCNGSDLLIASSEYESEQSEEQTDKNGKHFVKIVSGTYTNLFRFTITDGKIEAVASAKLPGSLLNQFSMDAYNGYYRVVVTRSDSVETIWTDGIDTYEWESSSDCALLVLDGDLNAVGKIENLAKDERVQSVRFMGDIAYFVTFRQVDPLFSADLSDPSNPKILSKLKIPGFSAYMHPFGEGLLLGIGYDADEEHGWSENVKLSMFDISDPADVKEAFKLSVKDVYWTSVQYNHKIVFVDAASGTIAFPADNAYYVFRVEDNSFKQVGKIETDEGYWFGDGRGLFVEDAFYVIGNEEIVILSFETMEKLAKIELN